VPIKICPLCQDRVVYSLHNNDILHRCVSGDTTLDQEDVLFIGAFTDFDGSGTKSKGEVMFMGTQNELDGTRAGIEGADFDGVTDRGKKKPLYRQRSRIKFMEFR